MNKKKKCLTEQEMQAEMIRHGRKWSLLADLFGQDPVEGFGLGVMAGRRKVRKQNEQQCKK